MQQNLSCSCLLAWWNASVFCDANSNLFLPNSRSATRISLLPRWGATLTCHSAFLQDSYLQQFLNELCQSSCWYDSPDSRACEAEWLMMHTLLIPVEHITDPQQNQGLYSNLTINGTVPPFGHEVGKQIWMAKILQVREVISNYLLLILVVMQSTNNSNLILFCFLLFLFVAAPMI